MRDGSRRVAARTPAGARRRGSAWIHLEEGWVFAGFFLVVGTMHVIAALLLLRSWPALWFWFGIGGSAAVIAVWVISRTTGLPFGPDPRATIALPQLADRAVVGLVAVVGVALGLLSAYPTSPRGWWPGLMRGMLAAAVVASGAVVWLTLPAASGQNVACTYAPLAEVSLTSHSEVRAAPLEADEERWFGAVVLSACGGDPVQLESAQVLNSRGQGEVLAYALLLADERLPDEGAGQLPADSQRLDAQPVLRPGEQRQLAVLLRARAGPFNLDSLRVGYRLGDEASSVAFATVLGTCPPSSCAGE